MGKMLVTLKWNKDRLAKADLEARARRATEAIDAEFDHLDHLDVNAMVDESQQFVQLAIDTDASEDDAKKMTRRLKEEFLREEGREEPARSRAPDRGRGPWGMAIYKRNQGRITRQLTLAALAIVVGVAAWRLHQHLASPPRFLASWFSESIEGWWPVVFWGLPFVLALLGWYASARAVNSPRFADFLIAVEAEMAKVSWPTWGELVRSSVVVLVTIFVLAAALFVFDGVWSAGFRWLGIL